MEFLHHRQFVRADQQVHIYSEALLANLNNIRKKCLSSSTNFCAVIKADGYGHGIRGITKILMQGGVNFFAVANYYEAAFISDIVGNSRILVLEPLHNGLAKDAVTYCAQKNLDCAIVSIDSLKFVCDCLKGTKLKLKLHVKVETGMGRCGVDETIASELIKKIDAAENTSLAGVYTHFSTAAEKDLSYAQMQVDRFKAFIEDNGIRLRKDVIVHASNSAAMLNMPYAHFDMVRCGIALYGWPEHRYAVKIALEPIMKFEVPVIQLNKFKKGQTVGYARSFTAARDTIGAIVPVGYSDNYWRLYSNSAVMKIADRFAKVIGRISMDKCVLDVTDFCDIKVGQTATVIDNDPKSLCSAYRLAELADTICHEVLTALPPRAMRIIH